MFKRSLKRAYYVAVAVAMLAFVVPQARTEDENRGIISLPVLFFPDGTLLIGHNGDDSLTDFNHNGLFEVLPGDQIVIGGVTNEVPELPGYPNGTPYEYDPSGPYIIGGQPLTILNLDGTPTTFPSSFPGANGLYGDDDDIIFVSSDPNLAIDDNGYLIVTGNGAGIEHRDGSPLDGSTPTVGSIIAYPNIVISRGSGSDLPAAHINPDGTVHLVPGNTIDLDGDGQPPWEVPEPGTYDPVTGLFYPDSDPESPYPVPAYSESEFHGTDSPTIIESIYLDATSVFINWPNYISTESYLSEILTKVDLNDLIWERLKNGERGVVINGDGAIIPRVLESQMGGSPGVYRFFKRVVPNHGE